MPIAGVVADANVLLSAIVGKAALRVFTEYNVAVHVARFNVDEVEEYLPHMAEKYDLPAELVRDAVEASTAPDSPCARLR